MVPFKEIAGGGSPIQFVPVAGDIWINIFPHLVNSIKREKSRGIKQTDDKRT